MIENSLSNSQTVVQLEGVTRRFGSTTALLDVSLSVARGTVFGLVGVNGAGKTTLLKHVLGLLRAGTGRVRVFGLDPVADPVGVLSKVGYLSERRTCPTGCGSTSCSTTVGPSIRVGTISTRRNCGRRSS